MEKLLSTLVSQKFTGKGESIGNQIEECKKHIAYKYQITDMSQIVVYEDEGFSGKNTKRPQISTNAQSLSKP